MIKLNGMAHLVINVSKWGECKIFYKKLMPFLGMKQVFGGREFIYFVGSRTAIGIKKCKPEYNDEVFQQERVGLHHFCLRSRSKVDIIKIHQFLLKINAKIINEPKEGEWAPGYYSILFEDPVGTRIEVSYVPGKGVLENGAGFAPGEHYR